MHKVINLVNTPIYYPKFAEHERPGRKQIFDFSNGPAARTVEKLLKEVIQYFKNYNKVLTMSKKSFKRKEGYIWGPGCL